MSDVIDFSMAKDEKGVINLAAARLLSDGLFKIQDVEGLGECIDRYCYHFDELQNEYTHILATIYYHAYAASVPKEEIDKLQEKFWDCTKMIDEVGKETVKILKKEGLMDE